MLDRSTLVQRCNSGEKFAFLYFWSHREPERDPITKACLSQFYPSKFLVDGQEYPTAEHWMMAGKARLFEDQYTLSLILSDPRPVKAKKLGREVQGFDPERWTKTRVSIVVEGNLAKFGQNDRLKQFLLSTGDLILVEASPDDQIWGIGLDESDPKVRNPSQWLGENLLGFALMEVRRQLLSA